MKHLGYMIACFITLLNANLVKAQDDVKIGTQVWTSKNLDVSTFRNGEAIPEAKNAEEWVKAGENKQPAWCYYDNNVQNGKNYGKLYNWYAVNDSRGLAPKGYHIPSDADWTILINFLGGMDKAGYKMKSKSDWQKNVFKSGNGNNSSGFNGLPGGTCHGGYAGGIGELVSWWSSNTGFLSGTSCGLSNLDAFVQRYPSGYGEGAGLSVRCLRD